MGNLQLDWILISSMLGAIIFTVTNLGIFIWLLWFKPETLRSKDVDRTDTTLDWKVIGEIMLHSSSFSGGVVLLLNTIVFMITGVWNLDVGSLGILELAFALMLFRSFDGFLTNLLNRKS